MRRRIVNEHTAKTAIVTLTGMAVFLCAFFVFGAVSQPVAAGVSGGELMAAQQEQLAKEQALATQVEGLEEQLAAARRQNRTLEGEKDSLEKDKERMENAELSIMDAMTLSYQGEFYATSYCCEVYPHICGGNGVTASGTVPTPGLTCAADWSVFPPGTWLYIEGVGLRRVEDSGSAIKQKRLDIAVDTHANALRWPGQGYHHVWVLNFNS